MHQGTCSPHLCSRSPGDMALHTWLRYLCQGSLEESLFPFSPCFLRKVASTAYRGEGVSTWIIWTFLLKVFDVMPISLFMLVCLDSQMVIS